MSENFLDLFSKLVAFDPTERPLAADILKHPWLNENIATSSEVQTYFVQERQKIIDANEA